MNTIKILLLAGLFASCNSQDEKTDKTSSEQAGTNKSSSINCYSYASANDTVYLKVVHTGDSITGTLVYRLKEKDKNQGTIRGNMRGDILIADYAFMSEGIQSTRQVAFKKEANSFVEGYGDFKNIDSLKFNSFMKLVEVACQ